MVMTTKNEKKELVVVQHIFDLDNQYETLFHASKDVVNRWFDSRTDISVANWVNEAIW